MSLEVFASVIKKRMTPEGIHQILEDITALIVNGVCPICEMEEIPVDAEGNIIEDDDVSGASYWREQHSDECPVTWIEQNLKEATQSV